MSVIRVDGFYLYSTGFSLHPLEDLKQGAKFADWALPLLVAHNSLEQFINNSVYKFEACRAAGEKLLRALQPLTVDFTRDTDIEFLEAYAITSALSEFEHVLGAEFGVMNMYLINKIRGYNTTDLVGNGAVLFPEELAVKAPDAVPDLGYATRCIAFELATAAGFHLHRANESVMHRYYDVVAGGKPRPVGRNIGDYLAEMKRLGVGDLKIISALKDLKDLHRNPLIHPEDSLEDIDEAIALLGSVQGVVVPMLKVIPFPTPPTPSAGASVVT